MDKLIPTFKDSIFNDNVRSLLADLGEIGIDSVLDDGIFKSLPIVGTIIGLGKTAQRFVFAKIKVQQKCTKNTAVVLA